jgi:hypothetical protein
MFFVFAWQSSCIERNSDSAPVNAFARSTSGTTNNSQWVFDTQGAGWEVRAKTATHLSIWFL